MWMDDFGIQLPFKLADYQKEWLKLVTDRKINKAVVIACRSAAKSYTIALACVFLCFKYKGYQVSIVPGGRQGQGDAIMDYFRSLEP